MTVFHLNCAGSRLEMKQVLSEFDEINKSPESYKQYDSINAIIMEAMSYD